MWTSLNNSLYPRTRANGFPLVFGSSNFATPLPLRAEEDLGTTTARKVLSEEMLGNALTAHRQDREDCAEYR